MRWLGTIVRHLEESLAAVLMAIMVAIVRVDVFGRYVLNHPLQGAGQLTTTLLIWQVFLASAGALRRGLHVGIEFVIARFPTHLRALTDLVVNLAILVMIMIVGILGWEYAWASQTKRLHMLNISFTWVTMAVPVGCLLMCVHLIRNIWEAARGVLIGNYAPERLGFAGTGAIMPEESSKAEEQS